VMLLVKAGPPVDDFIQELLPVLEKGDIIIDGGNSLFEDTNRRQKEVEAKGLLYIGTGVSGGEEGARHGPSIMPGGSPAAWPFVKKILQDISAKVDGGTPCCDWVGEQGAGHYVKMVHNGIEYGDMQLICEAYNLMKNGLGMTPDEMHKVFAEWNKGELDSYLIEISGDILAKKDADGSPLVDKILDTAGQKGTGKWTVINSQELGIPITLMAEAVYARCVSALKDERVAAARKLKGPKPLLPAAKNAEKKKAFVAEIRDALYASKIISYAQGYMLMRAAAKEYKWNLVRPHAAIAKEDRDMAHLAGFFRLSAGHQHQIALAQRRHQLLVRVGADGLVDACQSGGRAVVVGGGLLLLAARLAIALLVDVAADAKAQRIVVDEAGEIAAVHALGLTTGGHLLPRPVLRWIPVGQMMVLVVVAQVPARHHDHALALAIRGPV
ncbi:decarboxylating NADP(+)-dependent phosphogluconate dehydrogenase, partial [bacterium]|nr:decarboxylating NADP(+)-dependent phosphogluconate dehydrogenase [bacterium]